MNAAPLLEECRSQMSASQVVAHVRAGELMTQQGGVILDRGVAELPFQYLAHHEPEPEPKPSLLTRIKQFLSKQPSN